MKYNRLYYGNNNYTLLQKKIYTKGGLYAYSARNVTHIGVRPHTMLKECS